MTTRPKERGPEWQYRQRWHIELDLRDIKTTLGMEYLRCRSREMAIKELWVYLG